MTEEIRLVNTKSERTWSGVWAKKYEQNGLYLAYSSRDLHNYSVRPIDSKYFNNWITVRPDQLEEFLVTYRMSGDAVYEIYPREKEASGEDQGAG